MKEFSQYEELLMNNPPPFQQLLFGQSPIALSYGREKWLSIISSLCSTTRHSWRSESNTCRPVTNRTAARKFFRAATAQSESNPASNPQPMMQTDFDGPRRMMIP